MVPSWHGGAAEVSEALEVEGVPQPLATPVAVDQAVANHRTRSVRLWHTHGMNHAASGIEIRPYEPQDRDGFARLVSHVLAEYGFTVDPLLEADLDAPQSCYQAIWVAVDDGQVVGSVAMRVLDDGMTAELKRMYLQPAYRGRSLGRSLLDQAIAWAQQRPCRTIVLDTSQAMTAAQRLYESVGFHRTGTRTEQGSHDARCEVLYALSLAEPA